MSHHGKQNGKQHGKQHVAQQGTDVSVFDIAIIGGGIVGLSLANELIGSDFSVLALYLLVYRAPGRRSWICPSESFNL